MKNDNILLKWYNRICDVFEVYVPSLVFIFMFLSYVVLIIYRYLFKASFDWLYELNSMSFVWCGIFAASYGSRADSHVKFTILYDKMPDKVKILMRIVADLSIVVLFCMLFPKAMDNLAFQAVRKSSILKIRYNIVFLPFMFFAGLTILHHIIHLINDILALAGKRGIK